MKCLKELLYINAEKQCWYSISAAVHMYKVRACISEIWGDCINSLSPIRDATLVDIRKSLRK